MDLDDVNPIKKFEGLSRNQKLMVFGGAALLGGYLYYHSKRKAATEEGEGEEGEYEPNGVSGAAGEGGPTAEEGIFPNEGELDPYLGGGFGGSTPPGANNAGNTSNADGTVPSIPTGGTTNVAPGGVGSQVVGEGGVGVENNANTTNITGGGAPVTPHPAHAHLPKKKSHPHKSPAKSIKVQKRRATHTRKKKVVHHAAQHAASKKKHASHRHKG